MSTGDIPARDSASATRVSRSRVSTNYRIPSAPPTPPVEADLPPLIIPEEGLPPYTTWYGRTMAFFGYGRRSSKARRELVTLIWNLSWGFVQASGSDSTA